MVPAGAVAALVLAIPGTTDGSSSNSLDFSAHGHRIAWSFKRRIHPKKARVPDLEVLAVRCSLARKDLLVEVAPDVYFDDDHYRGFPAVMVRLAAIEADDLRALLADAAAWARTAPAKRPRKG